MRFDHDKMKALREAAGISQTELAGRAGVHFNTIAMLERDGGNPTASTIASIARVLDVEPGSLFTETEAVA